MRRATMSRREFVTRVQADGGLLETRASYCRGTWAGLWSVSAHVREDVTQSRWKTVGEYLGPFAEREEAEVAAERLAAMIVKVRKLGAGA